MVPGFDAINSYLIDGADYRVHHLALVRFEHDGLILDVKLRQTAAREYLAFTNVLDGDNSDDVPESARTRALNVLVKLVLQVGRHGRTEIRRMKMDDVREFFLWRVEGHG